VFVRSAAYKRISPCQPIAAITSPFPRRGFSSSGVLLVWLLGDTFWEGWLLLRLQGHMPMSTAMLPKAIGIMVPYPPSLPFALLLREADDVDNLQVTWGYVLCPSVVFRYLILSAISVGIRVNDTGTPTITRL